MRQIKRVIFLLSILLGVVSCASFEKAAPLSAVSSGEISKNSIYQISSTWTDHTGKKVQLKNFAGQKVLIGMIFTKCPHACPMTVELIQDLLKQSQAKNIKVVLASFDPKRDRPERLGKYIIERNLDSNIYSLLAAETDAQVRELAIVLGINYKDLGDGDFSHSNVITLLSPTGEVVEILKGFVADQSKMIQALKN